MSYACAFGPTAAAASRPGSPARSPAVATGARRLGALTGGRPGRLVDEPFPAGPQTGWLASSPAAGALQEGSMDARADPVARWARGDPPA